MATTCVTHLGLRPPLSRGDPWTSARPAVSAVASAKAGQNTYDMTLDELKKSLKSETVLVSVQYANNEIGTIQPISEIAKIIRQFRKAISYQLKHDFHRRDAEARRK